MQKTKQWWLLGITSIMAVASAIDFPRLGEECQTDADCFDVYETCNTELAEPLCRHKSLNPVNIIELIACLVTIVALFYSNCGGLGGGGIMIPVTLYLFGFDLKSAIALSNSSVAVASIIRYLQNLPKSHPLKEGNGVLVDYTLATIMLPAIVVGVIAGTIVNKIFPSVILAGALVLLLLYLIVTTWLKLCKIQKAEAEEFGPLCGDKKQADEEKGKGKEPTKEENASKEVEMGQLGLQEKQDNGAIPMRTISFNVAGYTAEPQISEQPAEQLTPRQAKQNQEAVVRALHSPAFGRFEDAHQNLPDGSIAPEETSKSDANNLSDQMGLDSDNENQQRPFSPTGAGINLQGHTHTEEDVTYIVNKKQSNKIVEKRRSNMGGARLDTLEEPTYIGMKPDFNAGIQQREVNRDVTAELTQIAGNQNQKPDTGTFAEIRAPEEVILETVPKMFSQNEQVIKEDLKEVEKDEKRQLEDTQPVQSMTTQERRQSKKEKELERIIKAESTNLQWLKLCLNFGMLLVMVICMVLRGPGNEKSLIGVQACDTPDFLFLILILVAAIFLTFIAIKSAQEEYQVKLAVGYKFVKGDQEFTGAIIAKLIAIGFFGAFLSASVGLGPGSVFNPVMVQLNMHYAVASSTGMYLTMFTALSATINMLIFKRIDVQYMAVIAVLTVLGSIPGIFMQSYIRVRSGGRTQYSVGILISVLVIIAVTVTPWMVLDTIKASKSQFQDEEVLAFQPYC